MTLCAEAKIRTDPEGAVPIVGRVVMRGLADEHNDRHYLLVDGIDSIKLFGEEIRIKAHRHTIGGLSAHTDQSGLLDWFGAYDRHPRVALVHGEDDARKALALALKTRFDVDAQIPAYGDTLTI